MSNYQFYRPPGLNQFINKYSNVKLHKIFYENNLRNNSESDKKSTIDDPIFQGMTLLHMSTRLNNPSTVHDILKLGANPDVKANKKFTPLMFAMANGNAEIVRRLVKHGCNVHESIHNEEKNLTYTYLHWAVDMNNLAIVKALLRGKADPNKSDSANTKPLYLAARDGYLDIAKVLLESGARVDDKNENGRTATFAALKYGHDELFELLVCSSGCAYLECRERGESLLHVAATRYRSGCARLLLELGVNVDVRTPRGKTPLHLAVERQNRETVELLIESGADLDLRDFMGHTAAHMDVTGPCNEAVFELLLENGADVNLATGEGETPMHTAVRRRLGRRITRLRIYGANVYAMNERGQTPLDLTLSSRCCAEECLERLLLSGADFAKVFSEAESPLFRRRELLELFAKFAVKKKAADLGVDSRERKALEVAVDLSDLSKFKERCAEEVRSMRLERIGEDASFYDFLHATRFDYFDGVSRPEIRDVFEAGRDYELRFPLYKNFLEWKYFSVKRYELIDSAAHSLNAMCKFKIPCLVVHNVLKYLNDRHLKKLIRLANE